VDLIYENLPNIPDNRKLNTKQKASRYNPSSLAELDESARRYLLESHYSLLVDAHDILSNNGSVICSIGGRAPLGEIERIVNNAGYINLELVAGFKKQTEPWEVLPGYAAAEKDGVEFDFYLYDDAVSHLKSIGMNGAFAEKEGYALKKELLAYRINAKEALQIYETSKNKGNVVSIGHTVHMIQAVQSQMHRNINTLFSCITT
jgi:hypothetical protein